MEDNLHEWKWCVRTLCSSLLFFYLSWMPSFIGLKRYVPLITPTSGQRLNLQLQLEGTQLRVPLGARIQWTEKSWDLGQGIAERRLEEELNYQWNGEPLKSNFDSCVVFFKNGPWLVLRKELWMSRETIKNITVVYWSWKIKLEK